MVPIRRTVTDFLEHARECAQLADKLTGDDKAKLLEVAEEWLRLAEEAAEPVFKD